MKTIIKSPADECLSKAAVQWINWDEFVKNAHNDYLRVRNQAVNDQWGECAYTGLWIGEGSKQKIHLDHFYKKSIYKKLEFDWKNLFAAAKAYDFGADYKDRQIFGERAKTDELYLNFFSPNEVNLENLFWYQQDGRVDKAPNVAGEMADKVMNTIEMFNLNAPELVKRRHDLMRKLRDMKQLDKELIRQCFCTAGFSFVVEFVLLHQED